MKKLKFFFPDSHDYIDPLFDFEKERGNEHRVRQRDDYYPHEVFDEPPYDGMLVSKAIVDGTEKTGSRYTIAQRQRFYRHGVKKFLRLPESMDIMGDCGAFSYVAEYEPPYTVDEVVEYYERSGFDLGISMDHIIFAFETQNKRKNTTVAGDELIECKRRKELTLHLANEFLQLSKKSSFTPMGVAHGWNPQSMADSVIQLQKMGYQRITLGGMVPLPTADILRVLEACSLVRNSNTEFHLLGISRVENASKFSDYGVTSFDSTSPLAKAFKDDKHNYYFMNGEACVAIKVPQVDGNLTLKRAIAAGRVDQDQAKKLEKACMQSLRKYDTRLCSLEEVVQNLGDYEKVIGIPESKSKVEEYTSVLELRPWEQCKCNICRDVGVNVVIFRGAERNRRRGFHNIYILKKRLEMNSVR